MEATELKTSFTLPNKKVKVQPIKRKGGWLNELHPDHEANFLVANAKIKYAAPTIGDGRVANPLTKEERVYLEKVLDEDLNPLKKENNFWTTRFAILDRGMRVLDLSNPLDYIDYKILLMQKDRIAPSGDDKYKKGTYKYYIDDLEYEDKAKYKGVQAKKEAYKFFGKLEQKGKSAYVDFLNVYYQNQPGKKADMTISEEKLVATIDGLIEEETDRFLTVCSDAEYENKLFIIKALKIKAIIVESSKYHLPTGEIIANSIDDLVLWLKDGNNNEEYLQIQARIEQSEN